MPDRIERSMDLKKYLKEKKEAVDTFFRDYFKEQRRPVVLQEAMLYSLFAGGKRVRPILAMAAYEACGGSAANILPYASSLELIHTYSLIHDDLPAMDDDDLRRGKPTSHKVYGEAVAILAGDALLTEAFCILSDPSYGSGISEKDLLNASREIAVAAGYQGMVAGQVQDILSENAEADADTLQFIHRHKTAALICASAKVGGILAGGGADIMEALTSYGENIGHAFQVIDDILDVEGDTKELGKTVGSDEKINKMTYPRLYGLERSREIAKKLVDDAVSSLNLFSSGADPLREIARYLLERRN
ncbi:MAG TPA: farnesyl diphosphate synthase [Candidatus Sulfobium mesophilum]|nr:farnesyl diphosphate synthase [Candidatus Sulfobium mesophilum]